MTQANPGDTVSVAGGTYTETSIAINKPLTLQGAGASQTIVRQDPANPGSTPTGLIRIANPTAGDLNIDGFTLEAANSSNADGEPFLIYAINVPAGGQTTVSNSSFVENTTLDPTLGSDYSVGLYYSGSAADLRVTGDTFQGMFQGVFLESTTGAATISGNTFTGLLASDNGCGSAPCGGNRMPQGIFLFNHGGVAATNLQSISANAFSGFSGQPITLNAQDSGSGFSNVQITGNNIAALGANDVTGNAANSIHLVTRDSGAISSVKITGNNIAMPSGPGRAGIFAAETTPGHAFGSTSGIVAHFNRIVGSFTNGVQNNAGPSIDATENWWGCNTGPNTAGCSTTGGTGGAIASSPYLVLSAGANPSTVAQGQPSAVTASVATDSAGATPSSNSFPAGIPVGFTTDLGSVSPSTATTASPFATTAFSSSTAGTANVRATLDNATATTKVTVTNAAAPGPAGPGATPPLGGPTVAFVLPPSRATLPARRATRITLNVTAPAGVSAVKVTFTGRQVCSFTTAPYTCTFNPTRSEEARRGVLVATVTDSQGRSATTSRTVFVGGRPQIDSTTALVTNGIAAVSVRCAPYGPCAGNLSLRTLVRISQHRRRMVTVGSAQFRLRTGTTANVRVRLSDTGLGLIRRTHPLNVRGNITSANGFSGRVIALIKLS